MRKAIARTPTNRATSKSPRLVEVPLVGWAAGGGPEMLAELGLDEVVVDSWIVTTVIGIEELNKVLMTGQTVDEEE